ncbi:MAG: HAD family hydrolase, partial [Bacteroidaceae bacterium]|nr:HAD family hydrolase [Bacteroidaceae bacterium]
AADDALLDACAATYRRLFDGIAEQTAALFPGVAETLRALAPRYTLCVASSRGGASLRWFLRRFGVEDCIALVLGEEDVVNKKPAPDMVLRILADTATAPGEALVVGDTVFDIEMGRRAACPTCGVTYGNHTAAQLQAAGATFLIDRFPALADLLD